MRAIPALFVALLAVTLVMASRAEQAQAHAAYARSSPGDGGVVSTAPQRIEIWFTQELFRRAGANLIQVTDSTGVRFDTGDVLIDSADRTHMSVTLRPGMSPGAYTVAWTSLSATDGDPAEGSFRFTVDPLAAETSTTATPLATQEPNTGRTGSSVRPSNTPTGRLEVDDGGSSFPRWAVFAAAAVLIGGGLAAGAVVYTGRGAKE